MSDSKFKKLMEGKIAQKIEKDVKKASELSFDAVLGVIILVGFGFLLGLITRFL